MTASASAEALTSHAPPGPEVTSAKLARWLLPTALRRLPALASVLATMFAGIALDLLTPWPMKILVDNVLRGEAMTGGLAGAAAALPGPLTRQWLLAWVVGSTIAVYLAGWLLGLARNYAGVTFGRQIVFDVGADVFAHLQSLSLRFHRRGAVGDLMRRVTSDCGAASTIVKDAVLPSVAAVISLFGMFAVMWRLDSELALLTLLVIPLIFAAVWIYKTPMLERSYEQQWIEGKLYALVEQTLSALPVVQAFSREKDTDRRFRKSSRELLGATLASTHVQLRFKVLVGFATAAGTASILWVGGSHALDGRLTIGGLLVFLAYLRSFYGPLQTLGYAPSTIQQAAGSARRVLEVLEHEPEVAERSDAVEFTGKRPHLRFENVTLGYEPNRPVLMNVSLEVEPGTMVAIVGKTGAGKTTLVSLVPRFMDPWSGCISLDGRDIRDLTLSSLRRNVAVVSQDVFLFPRSVAENIAYGRPGAERVDVEAAARAAQADTFIRGLPEGYDTLLGERGGTLSGGERQRISIARAFLADAPVLILDEATSALDAETESLLVRALADLAHGRTVMVIAHRLSTVRNADKVVVMEEGRVAESGPPSELLSAKGRYARYHALQFGMLDAAPAVAQN